MAPFGCRIVPGLRRRPLFVHTDTLRCVGENAYAASLKCSSFPFKETEFGKHTLSYEGCKAAAAFQCVVWSTLAVKNRPVA